MTNTNAFETVKEIIRNRVAVINMYLETDDVKAETFERMRNELMGMMICLKNICTEEKFFNINYFENRIEFGYYENHEWVVIEG